MLKVWNLKVGKLRVWKFLKTEFIFLFLSHLWAFDPIPCFAFVLRFVLVFCLTFQIPPVFKLSRTAPTTTDISSETFKQVETHVQLFHSAAHHHHYHHALHEHPSSHPIMMMDVMMTIEVSPSIILEPWTSEGWTGINNTSAVRSPRTLIITVIQVLCFNQF